MRGVCVIGKEAVLRSFTGGQDNPEMAITPMRMCPSGMAGF